MAYIVDYITLKCFGPHQWVDVYNPLTERLATI